jgi:Flp pilus assembly protein TadG
VRRRRGANAIEFALVMPVLFAIVTGMMDYSWIFMLRNGAMNAARVGARAGAITAQGDDPDGAAAASALRMWNGLGVGGDPTIVAFRTGDPQLMAVRVTVDVSNTIGLVLGPKQVQVTAVERMEDQP